MIELRHYQHNAIENLKLAISSGNKRILLQAATGAGKTIIACEMIRRATGKQKRVIFIAHRKEIITQTSGKLDRLATAAHIQNIVTPIGVEQIPESVIEHTHVE